MIIVIVLAVKIEVKKKSRHSDSNQGPTDNHGPTTVCRSTGLSYIEILININFIYLNSEINYSSY